MPRPHARVLGAAACSCLPPRPAAAAVAPACTWVPAPQPWQGTAQPFDNKGSNATKRLSCMAIDAPPQRNPRSRPRTPMHKRCQPAFIATCFRSPPACTLLPPVPPQLSSHSGRRIYRRVDASRDHFLRRAPLRPGRRARADAPPIVAPQLLPPGLAAAGPMGRRWAAGRRGAYLALCLLRLRFRLRGRKGGGNAQGRVIALQQLACGVCSSPPCSSCWHMRCWPHPAPAVERRWAAGRLARGACHGCACGPHGHAGMA